MAKSLSLEKILFSQGFGTRRYCQDLVWAELVKVNDVLMTDPDEKIDPEGSTLEVDGQIWQYQAQAHVVFHKPSGYECSHKPSHHPSVYSLLPNPLIERGIQCVGRLDYDTTGLLLLTDDGQLIHRLTSPKKNIGKRYRITLAEPSSDVLVKRLLTGVQLYDEKTTSCANACEITGEYEIEMVIPEGKYHQVKRMVAAAGNHVTQLHRQAIGRFELPSDLAVGQWRWPSPEELRLATQTLE